MIEKAVLHHRELWSTHRQLQEFSVLVCYYCIISDSGSCFWFIALGVWVMPFYGLIMGFKVALRFEHYLACLHTWSKQTFTDRTRITNTRRAGAVLGYTGLHRKCTGMLWIFIKSNLCLRKWGRMAYIAKEGIYWTSILVHHVLLGLVFEKQ